MRNDDNLIDNAEALANEDENEQVLVQIPIPDHLRDEANHDITNKANK